MMRFNLSVLKLLPMYHGSLANAAVWNMEQTTVSKCTQK